MSNLLCASLKEDPYGVAQRDIPRVLEALVRYLGTLDELARQLTETAEKQSPEIKERWIVEIEAQIGEVQRGESTRARALSRMAH